MASDGAVVRLADLCLDVRYGYTAAATSAETGTKFLRVTDIASGMLDWNTVPNCHISGANYGRFQLAVGDIVIARMGTIGVSALIKEPVRAVAASYLIRFRIDPSVADPTFVSYVLRSPLFRDFIWTHGGGGAVQPNINAQVLGSFEFPLPSLAQQRRVAHILGDLDDKIELNRRMSQTLEATARALFKSWFVDFDPVRAKAEGRDPGLPEHLARLFPGSFEDSELGEMPAGWCIATLGDVAVSPRRPVKPSEFHPATTYIGLEHMPRKSIALAEWGNAASLESGKAAFRRGEILFGKLRPYFHKGAAPFKGVRQPPE